MKKLLYVCFLFRRRVGRVSKRQDQQPERSKKVRAKNFSFLLSSRNLTTLTRDPGKRLAEYCGGEDVGANFLFAVHQAQENWKASIIAPLTHYCPGCKNKNPQVIFALTFNRWNRKDNGLSWRSLLWASGTNGLIPKRYCCAPILFIDFKKQMLQAVWHF